MDIRPSKVLPQATWADIKSRMPPMPPPSEADGAPDPNLIPWSQRKPVNIPGLGEVDWGWDGSQWEPRILDPESKTMVVLRPGPNGEIKNIPVAYGESGLGKIVKDLAPVAAVALGGPMLGGALNSAISGMGSGSLAAWEAGMSGGAPAGATGGAGALAGTPYASLASTVAAPAAAAAPAFTGATSADTAMELAPGVTQAVTGAGSNTLASAGSGALSSLTGSGITDEMLLTGQAGLGDLGVGTGAAAGFSAAGGAGTAALGGSIWDDIAKAVGLPALSSAAQSGLKDILGGAIGAYGANENASNYADTMKSVAQTYSDSMKYAIDQSDPFREQRPQYQGQLSDVISGKSNASNNPWLMNTATENNPNMMSFSQQNNPYIMNTDSNNPNMMSTSTQNNPWLTDTSLDMNNPLMTNLRDTTIDNTMRRLSSKYGGDASSLGVVNEVAKQVNAANAPLVMDYYKSGLANNQQYLNTATNNNQRYLGTAAANNLGYLTTAANNNNSYLNTASNNNRGYLSTLGQAAGANIQPQTGQIAAAGASGLANMMGTTANNMTNLNNQTYGNIGVAANSGLDWLFRNYGGSV